MGVLEDALRGQISDTNKTVDQNNIDLLQRIKADNARFEVTKADLTAYANTIADDV